MYTLKFLILSISVFHLRSRKDRSLQQRSTTNTIEEQENEEENEGERAATRECKAGERTSRIK